MLLKWIKVVFLVNSKMAGTTKHDPVGNTWTQLSSETFTHLLTKSLGQPLIVRSTAREEIPTRFPIIVTSIDSTDNKHGVQRQVHRGRQRRNLIYYIEYFRKAAGILLLGVWCKNIWYNIPIITHTIIILVGVWPDGLSPLEKLVTLTFRGETNRRVTLTVCLPEKSKVTRGFSRGDKPNYLEHQIGIKKTLKIPKG
jgi:hypothetical protein